MIELLDGLLEIIEWLIKGFAGWRYLLSSSYRRQTHCRWKEAGKVRATFEVIAGLSGITFTLLLAGVIVYLVIDPT